MSCARAADGVAALSRVRLALPLLYRSHCTPYNPLNYLTDEKGGEIGRMGEGVSQGEICGG